MIGNMGLRPVEKIEPMSPLPGLMDEGNVYRPIQKEGRPFSYMDRVQERKALEEVSSLLYHVNLGPKDTLIITL